MEEKYRSKYCKNFDDFKIMLSFSLALMLVAL